MSRNGTRDYALKVLGSTNGASQSSIRFQDSQDVEFKVSGSPRAFAVREFDPNETFPVMPLGLGVTAQLLWVTPDVARGLLASRQKIVQRSLLKAHLAELCRVHEAIGFLFNCQPLIKDWDDCLVDGQHRCEMVVRTGKPFLALLISGVDPSCFYSIDQGAKKQASQALKSNGVKNYSTVAAAASYLIRYNESPNFPQVALSSPTILATWRKFPAIEESATVGKACSDVFASTGMAAALHFLFRRIDQKLADQMFTQLITGADMAVGHPVLSLRNTLTKARKEKATSHFNMAVTIKAWNHLRSGYKKVPKLYSYEFRKETFPTIS